MKKYFLILTTALLSLNAFSQIPNYVPTNGLVVYYPFDGNANDMSGNNFNGTVSGAQLTTDRFGNSNSAYNFVSGNQIVSNPSLPIGNSARSISLWFQTSSTSYNNSTGLGANVMMSYGSGPGTSGSGVSGQLHCETEVGVLVLNHYGTALGGGSNFVSNGQWHNMIYTFDGSLHKLFLDGVLIDTDTYALNTGITSLYFGKRASEPNWHQYNGKVDEVGIWNRALTLCEIQSLYTGILPNTSVNAGADQAICSGTPVTLSATGASTYTWNNAVSNGVSFTPTSTTTYSVIGTDANGCIGIDQVVVTVNALPTVNAGIDQTVCAGTLVALSGSGANTYSWNNNVSNGVGFNPTVSNEYVVTGTDVNGCLGTDTVDVTVNNPSSSTLTETALGSYTLNGQTYTQSGTYTQVIPNTAGCDSTITLNLSLDFTGINETQTGFTIAPNPTIDVVTITSTDALYDDYVLFDPQGRKVLSGTLTGTTTQLDLSRLSRGNYLLQIGEKKTPIKLIKQ